MEKKIAKPISLKNIIIIIINDNSSFGLARNRFYFLSFVKHTI
ncbi:MAG: hypothetical protein P1U44_09750 [Vicingaceae bacterium]|nr:hypothetical protein [Vicingaceae bacterium]